MMQLLFVYDEDLGALCALVDDAGNIVSVGADDGAQR